MKRVAIISMKGTANVGGVERVVADHARQLREVAEVRVFSLPPSGGIAALRRSRAGNLLVSCAFATLSPLRARMWAGRDGVVISHGYSSIGLFCDIVFAHGCWAGYVEHTGARMGPFGRFIFSVEWLAAHLARKVVGVSGNVVEQWARYYGLNRARSAVQFNSIDTSVFFPRHDAGDPCSSGKIRVLFVGRFEPGKGTAFLSRLHDQIASEGEEMEVSICSPTEVSSQDRGRHPRFRFLVGLPPDEVAAEYNRADVFLLPSLYEAFELSSIEALACGTPVMLNPTGARPTLEDLSCPGVFRLEEAPSPLAALQMALARFTGLRRTELARWTQAHFDDRAAKAGLFALTGVQDESQ